jgi:hypothetical protein
MIFEHIASTLRKNRDCARVELMISQLFAHARTRSGFGDEVRIMNLIQIKESTKHFYDRVNTIKSGVSKEGMI